MIAKAAKQVSPHPTSEPGGHRALTLLFREYEQARRDRNAANERVMRFEETIRLLIDDLPSEDRREFAHRFDELRHGAPVHRGGEVLETVVALFQKHPRVEFSVPEIQSVLERSGTAPEDQKSLYNAINYLAKTGRLRRVSRGRYVAVDYGLGIEHEGREDGTGRLTEHDL